MSTLPNYDYEVHPYAAAFPDLSPDDFAKLKEDIRVNHQINPIVVNDHRILLDGRNRLRACKELGITPFVRPLSDIFATRDTAMSDVAYIDSQNIHRRHLTDDQKAALAVLKSEHLEAQAKEAQKRKPESVLKHSPKQKPVHVRKQLAAENKVSESKIRDAQTLKKKVGKKVVEEVSRGKITLKDAKKNAGIVATTTPGKGLVWQVDAAAYKWLRKMLEQFTELQIEKTSAAEMRSLIEDSGEKHSQINGLGRLHSYLAEIVYAKQGG